MTHVSITIAGQNYRMACEAGEEDHLQKLGSAFDGKIKALQEAFGDIGDMRLQVMAALTFADDLTTAQLRITKLEAANAALSEEVKVRQARIDSLEERIAANLNTASDRIEKAAKTLITPELGA